MFSVLFSLEKDQAVRQVKSLALSSGRDVICLIPTPASVPREHTTSGYTDGQAAFLQQDKNGALQRHRTGPGSKTPSSLIFKCLAILQSPGPSTLKHGLGCLLAGWPCCLVHVQ